MKYGWRNLFNNVEDEVGLDSEQAAIDNAVATYVALQDGFAFHIAIFAYDDFAGHITRQGYIKGGVWFDGRFEETDEEHAARMGNAI
jgi:hypothetical protein